MNRKHGLLLAAILTLATGHASASTQLFHDDAVGFAAALAGAGLSGALVNGNLPAAGAAHSVSPGNPYGLGDPDPIVVGAASFAGNNDGNAAAFLIESDYRIDGVFYSHQLFNGTDNQLTITFATPVRAFSFISNVLNFTIAGPSGPIPMILTTGSGDTINTTSTALYFGGVVDPPEAAPVVFNGLVSDVAFTSLTIATTAQAFDVTAFAYAPAPVPEPDTLVLMLAGLSAFGWLALKRT